MIYPTLKELLILSVVIAELVGAGYLIKRRWTARNETVPLSVAVGLWIGMFMIYFAVVAIITAIRADDLLAASGMAPTPDDYATDTDAAARAAAQGDIFMFGDPRIQILTTLGWALVLWTIPAFYFTWTIVTSLAARNVERIGPFSAKIEDPSEFAAARKLALRGDIDGAVSMYRTYRDNEVNALFEAVRLLKSEDRFAEAAEVLREIEARFENRSRIWAEAAYQHAKLLEAHLASPEMAQALLYEILKRAPESRFAQLAGADLARLQIMHGVNWDDDDEDDLTAPFPSSAKKEATPPKALKLSPQKADAPAGVSDFVQPVPIEDPFFAASERRRISAEQLAAEEAAAAALSNARVDGGAAPKKRSAGKKAAASKKAPVKAKAKAKAKPVSGGNAKGSGGAKSAGKATPKKAAPKKKPSGDTKSQG